MPLPKRRHSSARSRKRRTHWKLTIANLVPCPQCKQLKLIHRVCKVCGYYDGRKAIEIEIKKKKPRKQ